MSISEPPGTGPDIRGPRPGVRRALVATATAALLALTACTGSGTTASSSAPAPAALAGTSAAAGLTLVTEPDQGLAPVYSFISSARRSLDMTMYELVDTTAENDLAADAARGVVVRVILDSNLERDNNQQAYTYLSAHGVHVVWAQPGYAATHQKTITVDGLRSMVLTLNLTSRYYSSTRDFAVSDTDPADVAAIEAVFDADFAGRAVVPGDGRDLVWSPTDAQPKLLAVIGGAASSLLVENEEMADSAVVSALVKAARRGVRVEVVMTDSGGRYAREFATLGVAGVQVRTYGASATPYIHAKVMVADAGTGNAEAFVGSQNFSASSLRHNLELGLITSTPAVVDALKSTLAADFAHAAPWS